MADPELDPESVERAFAELVAGYHLTSDRPDPLPAVERPAVQPSNAVEPPSAPPASTEPGPTTWRVSRSWAADHPLFASDAPEPEPVAPYVPEPLPPLARPSLPAMLGWLAVGFAALVVLAAGFGLSLPRWVGWLAVGSFICGFAVLLTQLPRTRPPGSGDGAVL